jgi:hypothetical protein
MLSIISTHLDRNIGPFLPDGFEVQHHPDGGYTLILWGKSEGTKNTLMANLEGIMNSANNILPLTEIQIKGKIESSFRAAPALKLYGQPCEGIADRMAQQSRN